jgi:flagellar hook assembly protein FlgD
VFIATESGMLSYFSTATIFDQTMENVRVFPNPVEPTYEGNITVDGLAYNSTIRITDTAGNVVYQGVSEGGRAFWNGKDSNGNRPATGVYYVFCSNPDGKKTEVLQFTLIH